MKILLVGASGLTGGCLLSNLLEDSEISKVYAWGRSPLSIDHPKLESSCIDFGRLVALEQVEHFPFKDEGAIICCIGTTIKKAKNRKMFKFVDYEIPIVLGKLAKKNNIEQMLLMSSMGANENSLFFYSKIKGMLEKELSAIGIKGLKIFRPSLLLGERDERRTLEKCGQLIGAYLKNIIPGKFRPIKAQVVADFMLKKLKACPEERRIYESSEMI